MITDFNPNCVSPLKFWVHTILPLVYEDSLSYYEVLAKVSAKMNEVIEGLNANNEQVEKVTQFTAESIKNLTESFNNFTQSILERQENFESTVNRNFQTLSAQLDGDIAEWETNAEENLRNQQQAFEDKVNKDFANLSDTLDSSLDTWETETYNSLSERFSEQIEASKVDVVQTTGQSTSAVMSQKAVTDAIAEGSGVNVVQTTGQSVTDVMSQKAVTDALASAGGVNVVQTEGQSTTDVMSQKAVTDTVDSVHQILEEQISSSRVNVVQVTGQSTTEVMSQKAVTDALASAGSVNVVQTTGESTADVMSQKAVTDALASAGGTNVVQTEGQSTTDVMSQKAVTDKFTDIVETTDRLQTDLTAIEESVVQTTGESSLNVMSQKAVTDELNGIKETVSGLRTDITNIEESVVQTTGESAVDIMSQKAVTDELNNIKDGYVNKSGDTMAGNLTVPTVNGDLNGNANTSTIPLGFGSREVKLPPNLTSYPFMPVATWVAPANTVAPVPIEQNDKRRLYFYVKPGNVLEAGIEGAFYQTPQGNDLGTNYIEGTLFTVLDRSNLSRVYEENSLVQAYETVYINRTYGKCVHLLETEILTDVDINAIVFKVSENYIRGSEGLDVTFCWTSNIHAINNEVHVIRYPESSKYICNGVIAPVGTSIGLDGRRGQDYENETVASIMVTDTSKYGKNALIMYFDTVEELSNTTVEGEAFVKT